MPQYLTQLLTQLFVLLNIILLLLASIMLDATINLKRKQKGGK
jgi:hypothetical protein